MCKWSEAGQAGEYLVHIKCPSVRYWFSDPVRSGFVYQLYIFLIDKYKLVMISDFKLTITVFQYRASLKHEGIQGIFVFLMCIFQAGFYIVHPPVAPVLSAQEVFSKCRAATCIHELHIRSVDAAQLTVDML